MSIKKVLFASWAVGLGHVTRDLAIARELRKLRPEMELSWLSCPPASEILKESQEKLLPYAEKLFDNTRVLEQSARPGHRLNI